MTSHTLLHCGAFSLSQQAEMVKISKIQPSQQILHSACRTLSTRTGFFLAEKGAEVITCHSTCPVLCPDVWLLFRLWISDPLRLTHKFWNWLNKRLNTPRKLGNLFYKAYSSNAASDQCHANVLSNGQETEWLLCKSTCFQWHNATCYKRDSHFSNRHQPRQHGCQLIHIQIVYH